MRSVKRAVLVVLALIIIFGIVIFILENQQPTALVFLGWHTAQLPQSLFFIGALLVGMAIGPAIGFVAFRRKAARSKRKVLVES